MPCPPSVRCSDCKAFNYSNIIRPHPTLDPPEMQFYRMRPFYVGESGRLAGHALQYLLWPINIECSSAKIDPFLSQVITH